jgi:signal transduction histidine kinase
MFKSYKENHKVTVLLLTQIDKNRVVMIDKHRVQQILINLISNAVKFSNRNRYVTVVVS